MIDWFIFYIQTENVVVILEIVVEFTLGWYISQFMRFRMNNWYETHWHYMMHYLKRGKEAKEFSPSPVELEGLKLNNLNFAEEILYGIKE